MRKRGADWLVAIQNPDGGWGENCDSYKLDYQGLRARASDASQTAWALLGADGGGRGRSSRRRARHPPICKATQQDATGLWPQEHYTGGGFPRVFYLNYHGYPKFFRSGLWRAIATCGAARGRSSTALEGIT